jgi:hypothetical protein
MKHIATKTTCFFIALALAFSSCKKDHDVYGHGSPGGNPVPESQYLQVPLNAYLPASKIDSALAIWEVNGVTQIVKMPLVENQFRLSLGTLRNNGFGVLTVQLFSQEKIDGKPLQWEHRVPYTLNKKQAVTFAAPENINDASWKPRVIFHYDNSMGSRFSAIIALRTDDPYFELKGVEPAYAKRIEIVRSFHQKETGVMAFSRGWVGQVTNLDNKGNLVDRLHFSNLREQLSEEEWNEYRIRASFFLNSNPSHSYEFGIVQDR